MNDHTTLRLIDASFNRAREAARVVEDVARFAFDSPTLSAEAKRLRHGLADALRATGALDTLPLARNTPGDVGRHIKAPREFEREGGGVLSANCKRLQESLRSLEEAAKRMGWAAPAAAFEALRYSAYTLETALVGHAHRRRLLDGKPLMVLVTESLCRHDVFHTVREVVAGGAGVIQLREKSMPDGPLLERARRLAGITRPAGALLVVNDNVAVARAAGADGVHLGQSDLPTDAARELLGAGRLLGRSVHTPEEARAAVREAPDFIGVGPLYGTATKETGLAPTGPAFVNAIRAITGDMPIYAIGGISPDNIAEAVAAGVRRAAVCGAVIGAEKPGEVARRLREALEGEVSANEDV